MRLTQSITIKAPIERVFSIIEENKEVRLFREDLIRADINEKKNSESPSESISTRADKDENMEERLSSMRGKSHFKGEITAYNKPYQFGMRIYSKKFQLLSNIDLSESPEGTSLRYTAQTVMSGRYGGVIVWFSNLFTRMMIKKQLKRLKAVAEN